MKSYQGAVLFVDMLGLSVLTRGQLKLSTNECGPWKIDAEEDVPHQLLAAQIILAFRRALIRTKKAFGTVRVAQLSDCAFLWSPHVAAVADAGRHLMHEAALLGLLCRGGLATGDIHEPNKVNHSLGAFIVGDAVTRAVTYESMGKGMRVFTDQETAGQVMAVRPSQTFQPLVNPMSGDTVDEWLWYEPRQSLREERDVTVLRKEVERLVGCHTMLRYSPKLAWSATTPEGRRQLACSIVAVSDAMERLSGRTGAYLFSVEHLLHANQVRSDGARRGTQQKFVDELMSAIRRG